MFRGAIRFGMTALVAATVCGGVAHAQTVKNGSVAGTLVSASAGPNLNLLTVPAGKVFVLTQFCSEDARAFSLTAAGVGIVPQQSSPSPSCTDYHPGIAFVGPTAITCTPVPNFNFGKNCLITGVMTFAK